jgi:pimeloyl-ACP methyl ester carboxylesterase
MRPRLPLLLGRRPTPAGGPPGRREALAAPPFRSHPDALYRVPTDDGAAISLGRYRPRGEPLAAPPVVLCHGLGCNRLALDLDERHSLARDLARRGFEAWVLELRGRGEAGAPLDATFDEEAEHDVGAALRAVLSTGAREVLWVGHSKGGLLLLAHLARNPGAPVRAGVLLGTPFTFALPPERLRQLALLRPLLRRPTVPLRALGPLAAALAGPDLSSLLSAGEAAAHPEHWRRAVGALVADVPGGVARQLAGWVERDRFESADGTYDYRAALAGVRVPLLLVAGTGDALVPAAAVERGRALLGGPVEVLVAGRTGGLGGDYGHLDLVLGRSAPEEIFPRVAGFLAAHAAPRP